MADLLHLSPLAAIGGCEVNCLRVIEGLPEHRHRVLVFDGPGPMSAKWQDAGARVDHLGAWRDGKGRFQKALQARFRDLDPPAGVFCWSTSRLPTVLGAGRDWTGRWAVYLGNPAAGGLEGRLRRRWAELTHTAPAPTILMACSGPVAESHRRAHYFRRFPLTVVYNAVAPHFFQRREHRVLAKGEALRIGMVARLDRIKDHETVLRALKCELGMVADFAGDGPTRAELERQARRLGVADRVRFLGFCEVAPLLRQWDIYVHSTTAQEGMGTAVAEAMAAGLPCVVTDLPVMREICADAARYAPPGDGAALARECVALGGDVVSRETLGLSAQQRAARLFSREEVAAAYLQAVLPDRRPAQARERPS